MIHESRLSGTPQLRGRNFWKAVRFFGFYVFHCGRASIQRRVPSHRRRSDDVSGHKGVSVKVVLGGQVDVTEKGSKRISVYVFMHVCMGEWVVQHAHTDRRPNCLAVYVCTIRTQCVLSYAFRPRHSPRSLTITGNADFWLELKNSGVLSHQEVTTELYP